MQNMANPCGFFGRSRRAICLLFIAMMLRRFICSVLIGAAISVQAGSVSLKSLTVGSTTYSNVTVFGANTTDLFFSSDQGVSNVKLKYLSPELQKKFKFDSDAAAKIEERQIDDEKRYRDNLAAGIEARLKAAREHREEEVKASYSKAGLGDAVSNESPLGQTAPEMNFTNWFGGKPNLGGRLAIISVWSPKSASSRKWIPTLNELHRSLAGKVEVVGVTTATEAEVSESDPKIDFPSAIDPDGKFLKDAGITMLPCVLLVDSNNLVRYQGHPAAVTTNTLAGLLKSNEE
jgi:hypothetical protein